MSTTKLHQIRNLLELTPVYFPDIKTGWSTGIFTEIVLSEAGLSQEAFKSITLMSPT